MFLISKSQHPGSNNHIASCVSVSLTVPHCSSESKTNAAEVFVNKEMQCPGAVRHKWL